MRLLSIALANLRRRKGRTLFQVLGLLVGIAAAVALVAVTTAMRADLERKIDEFGSNIVIVPKANDLALSYGGITLPNTSSEARYLHERDAQRLRTIKDADSLNVIAPKLLGAVEVGGRRLLAVGVRFPEELRMKRWWRPRGRDPRAPNEVLLGADAASKLRARLGSNLLVDGRRLVVAAVLAPTGSSEDDLLFMDLRAAQRMFALPGRVSMIEVAAWCSSCPIERIVAQAAYVLPNAKVTAVKQAAAARKTTVDLVTNFSIGIAAAILGVGALVVFTTMMAAVSERTREIGVFRAIGFRSSHVLKVFFFEVLVLSLLAGALGFLIGTAGAQLLAPRLAGTSLMIPWDARIAGGAVLLALIIGLTASWYPARRASRLDPVDSLRSL